jgi:hypothetical protein
MRPATDEMEQSVTEGARLALADTLTHHERSLWPFHRTTADAPKRASGQTRAVNCLPRFQVTSRRHATPRHTARPNGRSQAARTAVTNRRGWNYPYQLLCSARGGSG